MKLRILFALVAALSFAGCKNAETGDSDTNTNVSARTSQVNYVCIGMETSSRFGACPGCRLDSSRMNEFLKSKFGYAGRLLQSEAATRSAVVLAVKEAIARTPADGMFIFYYSGHGGQEDLNGWGTTEPDGADSEDEYLCLYDSYLLDDEVWKLISTCRGRVFLCIDACHSQTMFRSIQGDVAKDHGLAVPLEDKMVKSTGFRMKPLAMPMETGSFNMLCWSGCLEGEYSYGGSSGGVMTTAILSNWSKGITYDSLWNKTKDSVQALQPTQHPYATLYGTGFTEAFR